MAHRTVCGFSKWLFSIKRLPPIRMGSFFDMNDFVNGHFCRLVLFFRRVTFILRANVLSRLNSQGRRGGGVSNKRVFGLIVRRVRKFKTLFNYRGKLVLFRTKGHWPEFGGGLIFGHTYSREGGVLRSTFSRFLSDRVVFESNRYVEFGSFSPD